MALFRFDDFVFDSINYRLTYKGDKVTLRPKALKLLGFLIENRARVVTKAEIFSYVWGSDNLRDHLLFQLISELRKAPFDRAFIRTQPNQGYQWSAVTRVIRRSVPIPMQIAASLVFGIICIAISSLILSSSVSSVRLAHLPAHGAFSKGIIALEKGEGELAVEWFKFALNENPKSVESSLFLAETLFQLNKSEESSAHLQALLQKQTLDSYYKMTAEDLMSRIRQKQGRLSEALQYAQVSSQAEVIAQCSIDVVENRFETLADKLDAPVVIDRVHQEPNMASDLENYDEQCNQLMQESEETSYCQPNENEMYLVDAKEELLTTIS